MSATQGSGPVVLDVFRGESGSGSHERYEVEREPGMVVLDAVHRIQAKDDPALACRWNCKAGKCGSCSAEINGVPSLLCMTRVDSLPEGPITVSPIRTFPHTKDLVTDVTWNFRTSERITPFTPAEMTPEERERGEFNMKQMDVDRIQEFRKCIECFLCQNTCHVLRDHQKMDDFYGPRQMIRYAGLEMHPRDAADRLEDAKDHGGVGMCNITKCCSDVCPEHINLTDNGIIPLKERVAGRHYDPVAVLWRKMRGK